MGQVKIKQMDTPFGGRIFISYSKPQIDMKVEIRVSWLYEAQADLMKWNCNFGSDRAKYFFGIKPNVFGSGKSLRPFSGTFERSDSQDLGGGAVGGLGRLQEVTL